MTQVTQATQATATRSWLALLLTVTALALTACLAAPASPTPTVAPTAAPSPTSQPVLPTAAVTVAGTPLPAGTVVLPTATVPLPTATATVNPNVDPLTGVTVADPSLLQKRPLQICIGNDPGSRPAYGLSKADIVYEYSVDQHVVTRFTAVFWGQQADKVGPIRSARLVNLELEPQYDALLVCSGASDGVRYLLRGDAKIKPAYDYSYFDIDLDDPNLKLFSAYGQNQLDLAKLVQGNTANIHKWMQTNNKEKTVKINGFTFAPAPAATLPAKPATSITVPLAPHCCSVTWTYDSAAHRYMRAMDGAPHVDAASKETLSAANVVVVYARYELSDIVEDMEGIRGFRVQLTGQGKAIVFRDGVASEATWQRAGQTDFMQIVDAQGKAIPLRPGNSWIELVPDEKYEVTFQ